MTVYLASVKHEPARYKDHLREYLAMGMEISRGSNLWTYEDILEAGELSPAAACRHPLIDDASAAATFEVASGINAFMPLEYDNRAATATMALEEPMPTVGS